MKDLSLAQQTLVVINLGRHKPIGHSQGIHQGAMGAALATATQRNDPRPGCFRGLDQNHGMPEGASAWVPGKAAGRLTTRIRLDG